MRIKLRTTMAGPEGVHLAGKEVDLPDDQAEDLLLHGFADFVRTEATETANLPQPEETAVKAESKRRRGDRRIATPIDMATNTEVNEP